MAALSYKECKTWDEVIDFCKKHKLTYIEEKIYYNGIAKAVNENGCTMAYLVRKEDIKINNIQKETNWIWVLE